MKNLSWNGSIKMTPHSPVSGSRKGGVETDYSSHAWLAVQKECTSLVGSLIQLTLCLSTPKNQRFLADMWRWSVVIVCLLVAGKRSSPCMLFYHAYNLSATNPTHHLSSLRFFSILNFFLYRNKRRRTYQ